MLAQIVTNLRANCERHVPEARVMLRAYQLGDCAVVEVRDEGPGLSADIEGVALERGVQDSAPGGSGLGLHISRRLVEWRAACWACGTSTTRRVSSSPIAPHC